MRCDTCGKDYSPSCDYKQGRCPLHPPVINPHSLRFLNLISAIKKLFSK